MNLLPYQDLSLHNDGTYCHRWTLLRLWGRRGIYLHHFVGSDWSREMHDHPKRFISIGLRGGYVEEVRPLPAFMRPVERKQYRAPWLRTFPATHTHTLRVPKAGCWTIVVVLKETRVWGFWTRTGWVRFDRYINAALQR